MPQGADNFPVSTALSLNEFAPPAPNVCGACALPGVVRDEIESCRLRDKSRFTYPVISGWLKMKHEVDLHPDTLRRHFNRHVEGA